MSNQHPHFARIFRVRPLRGYGVWVETAMSINTKRWWFWHLSVSGISEEDVRMRNEGGMS